MSATARDSSATAKVRPLAAEERAWAAARYAEIGFAPSGEEDLLVIAEAGGERAGLGRLVAVGGGEAELGGIYVLPEHRGGGVARRIVAGLIERSPYRRLYCIPFVPLEGFYRSCGFHSPPPGLCIPERIQAKLAWCDGRYPDPVCLLVRDA